MKTESHAEKWWSHHKCPKDGTVCSVQRWTNDMFRVTCESCTYSEIALLASAEDLNGRDTK